VHACICRTNDPHHDCTYGQPVANSSLRSLKLLQRLRCLAQKVVTLASYETGTCFIHSTFISALVVVLAAKASVVGGWELATSISV
jgi:hypothetical protein